MTRDRPRRDPWELKFAKATDLIRVATETLKQELNGAEVAAPYGATSYERSPEREAQPQRRCRRSLMTTVGELRLRTPKSRQGSIFQSLLERRRWVCKALFAAAEG